jgi:2,4-diketo-3-deoxy-L-fuconate hydrolase
VRICRYGKDEVGVVVGDRVHDITSLYEGVRAERLPLGAGDALIECLPELTPLLNEAVGQTASVPVAECNLLSPVAYPSKIIGAPANYHLHIAEANADDQINAGTIVKTIDHYGLFLKAGSSLIGPSQPIILLPGGRRIDHEVELVVVIGRQCRNVDEADAIDVVAGYAIGNDVTFRGPEDRSLRKSVDTFTVLGPWLVTADEIDDPDNLDMMLTVNGDIRQQANTRDLIFGVRKLIAYASSFYTLMAGDLIYTGTPAGVGQITNGDVIYAEIEKIGSFRSTVAQ